jgi:hypothetical protein
MPTFEALVFGIFKDTRYILNGGWTMGEVTG